MKIRCLELLMYSFLHMNHIAHNKETPWKCTKRKEDVTPAHNGVINASDP